MNARLSPAGIDELVEAVKSTTQLLPVGAETKPRLSRFDGTLLETKRLSGLIEYDPSEFTFTALAGTPLREISAALEEQGQYLPFDPLLAKSGATLAGTVAAGLSGPGRFRYGGVRDFILGVRFVDGSGQLLRMGGKVVKNAAGFDLPKFFVGSLGRFGVLAEITFKVFPRPATFLTVKIPFTAIGDATRVIVEAARARWELDALDASLTDNAVFMRIGGPAQANQELASEILAKWPGEIVAEAESWWSGVAEFAWAPKDHSVVKVPLTPTKLPELGAALQSIDDARGHISAGGNSAWISVPQTGTPALDAKLRNLHLNGLTLRGEGALTLGEWPNTALARRVKAVLDPVNRFPSFSP
jgi:glycolate oxidase FAD binding subunit